MFALPNARGRTCRNQPKRRRRARGALVAADSIIRHEAGGAARRRSRAWQLAGRVPVGPYPVDVDATPRHRTARVAGREGARRRAEPERPQPAVAERLRRPHQNFRYLPSIVCGAGGILRFPTNSRLRRMTPRAARQLRPSNAEAAPAGTPIRTGGPIQHVFYIVRENRTYDQILGDDSRGDGDPKLTLFGENITPNAHALASGSRCSTTCTRTRRRRSTATSGRRRARCPTTS